MFDPLTSMKPLLSFSLRSLGIALLCAAAVGFGAEPEADYSRTIATHHAERLRRLAAPDGWLTLVGLHWLTPGTSTLGSAADNQIVLAAGPAHVGSIDLDAAGLVKFTPANGVAIQIDGNEAKPGVAVELRDDGGGKSSRVTLGQVSFQVLARGGKRALRVRDTEAATRRDFKGIETFPVDPAWRIEAKWVPFKAPRRQPITNVLGQVEDETVRGEAVFTYNGQEVRLLPIWDGSASEPLFFVIRDETSGTETYAAARFLDAEPPHDGKVILDFNLAINPPCAFTPYATCPLPPKQNRLPFDVRAGEKVYESGAAHP